MAIAEPLAGALNGRVGEGLPELRSAVSQRIGAVERLRAGGVGPVKVGGANLAKSGTAALCPSLLKGIEKVVHRASA